MKTFLRNAGLSLAKMAGYKAVEPNKTQLPASRIGSNPNSPFSQSQRIRLSLEGENAVKNTSFGINYLAKRTMYCSAQISYSPDTGDSGLDSELLACLNEEWETMGIECSMQDAFSRVADNFLPTSGDALLLWHRDEDRLRLIEVTADRIGEQWSYLQSKEIDGMRYLSGTFWRGCNRAGFRVYDRNGDFGYENPRFIPAHDAIFFIDDNTGGVRGVSKFFGALEDVNSRYQILKATKDTMLQQSKVAALATNNSGAPNEYDYQTESVNGVVEYQESFADGAIVKYAFNGDSYHVLKAEQPSEAFVKGLKYVDAQASLAMGFPYEFLISAADSGGAPSRLAINAASREIERIRHRVHRPRLNKISLVTIGDVIARGKIKLPRADVKPFRGMWGFGTLPTADAFRDDRSSIDAVRAGISTRNQVTISNYGLPYESVLRETQKETVLMHKAAQDANRELQLSISPVDGKPYEATASINDIALNSDNPAQSGAAEMSGAIAQKEPA